MFHKTASNEGTDYDTLMEGKKERHKTQSLPVKPTPYLQSTFLATGAWNYKDIFASERDNIMTQEL